MTKLCRQARVARFDEASVPKETRYDVRTFDRNSVEPIPGGGWRVRANTARTGVQTYRRADGTTRREYRPPEEVFAAESLASYRDAPVTVGHVAMIDSKTRRKHEVGHVSGPARQDGNLVEADLAIIDDPTFAKASSKDLAELSAGYDCRVDAIPGVSPEGEPYDAVQRDIRINHIALLPKGHARGGSALALRLDDWYHDDTEGPTGSALEANEMKIRIDGKDYEVGSPECEAALQALQTRADSVQDLTREKDRLDGLLAAEKAERVKAEQATEQVRKDSADQLDKAIADRVDLISAARKVLPTIETKADGKAKSDLGLMTEVVSKAFPEVKLDGRSEDYVRALFDRAVEQGTRTDSISELPKILAANRKDANDKPKPPEYRPAMVRGE